MRFSPFAAAVFFALCPAVVGTGCTFPASSIPASRPAAPRAALRRAPPVSANRWLVVTSGSELDFEAPDGLGGSRYVAQGLRMTEGPNGELSAARELLPTGSAVAATALPSRLGGGYVFRAQVSGRTLLWRAEDFTSRLTPLANLGFEVSDIVPGFDRLYVLPRRENALRALDLASGKMVLTAPLPASPFVGALGFASEWTGAVQVPFRGVLLSFDAGASWHPLQSGASELSVADGRLRIKLPSGRFFIEPDGELAPSDEATSDELFAKLPNDAYRLYFPPDESQRRNADATPARAKPDHWPLRQAVLRGYPDTAKSAVFAERGTLSRVSLSDGAVLATAPGPGGECTALPVGTGIGLVCATDQGGTEIVALTQGLGFQPLLGFTGARRVTANARGALLISGSCSPLDGGRGRYCVRAASGQLSDVHFAPAGARAAVLDDGRVAAVVPPRHGRPGRLIVVAEGRTKETALDLGRIEKEERAALENGLWLDGMTAFESAPRRSDAKLKASQSPQLEELRGWVAAGDRLVFVRVTAAGKVSARTTEYTLERSVLAGPFALAWTRGGAGAQSFDGGLNWTELELPSFETEEGSSGDPDLLEQGCSPVGCAAGSWIKLGWPRSPDPVALERAATPKPTRIPPAGGARWSLDCRSTGKTTRSLPAARYALRNDDGQERWLPFFDLAPPRLSRNEVGYDAAAAPGLPPIRAYVWGNQGEFARSAQWFVRVADRFSFADGVWSTSVAPSPWTAVLDAAQAFGAEPQRPTTWQAVADVSGRAAALLLRDARETRLFLLEPNRAPLRVGVSASTELTNLVGVARLDRGFFVAALSSQGSLDIFAVTGTSLARLMSFSDLRGAAGALAPRLVTDRDAHKLAIAVHTSELYVYPLDLEHREALAPLVVGAAALSAGPTTCSPETRGWLFEALLGVQPYMELDGQPYRSALTHVEARWLVSQGDVCVEAIAAQSTAERPPARSTLAENLQPTVPLVVTQRGVSARRWLYACGD